MPLLIGQLLPPVLLGILMAGLLAAFMSTHDSYLLAWASVISQDVVGPLKPGGLDSRQSILVTRVAVLGIGLFLLVFAVWVELPESVWTYMAVTGTVYLSGAATSLIGGMYWRRASATGALWALLGGLLALFGLFVEPLQTEIVRRWAVSDVQVKAWLNAQTIALATFAFCGLLFVSGSLLFPDRTESAGGDAA